MTKATFQEGFYSSISEKVTSHFNASFNVISLVSMAIDLYGDKAEEKLEAMVNLTAEILKSHYREQFDQVNRSDSKDKMAMLFLGVDQEGYAEKVMAMIEGHAENYKRDLVSQLAAFKQALSEV